MSRRIKCPYCQKQAQFLPTSILVYGKDYGPIYICEPCQAWVGCHKGTTIPFGRLADKKLRVAKISAHHAFDPIWKLDMEENGTEKGLARRNAYKWLAAALGIDKEKCHIGMFDMNDCYRVVYLCKERRDG